MRLNKALEDFFKLYGADCTIEGKENSEHKAVFVPTLSKSRQYSEAYTSHFGEIDRSKEIYFALPFVDPMLSEDDVILCCGQRYIVKLKERVYFKNRLFYIHCIIKLLRNEGEE